MYLELSPEVEAIASEIVDASVTVHKELGPGLLESIYEESICYELQLRGFHFERQVAVPLRYKDFKLGDQLRLDILVEDEIIIEVKAQESFHPVWEAQVLSYLKLTGKRLGFLLNFHVALMKKGTRRIIL